MTDPPHPPGWTYNPSSWGERLWLIGVALLGLAISAYLAGYQLHLVDDVWEPLFGSGSREVLGSFLSQLLPIPDAALGAFAYALDAVTGAIGGTRRWRTMPWMVLLFGLAVGPLGIVSVLLVIAQPVLLDAWCTLCLASAMIPVVMIGPAMDEVLASLQFLRRAHAKTFRCGMHSGRETTGRLSFTHRTLKGQTDLCGLGWSMCWPAGG